VKHNILIMSTITITCFQNWKYFVNWHLNNIVDHYNLIDITLVHIELHLIRCRWHHMFCQQMLKPLLYIVCALAVLVL